MSMKMTVSVNNQSGVPYMQYGTDKQKAKATKFVQSTDKDLTNLAFKINDRKHDEKKFAKNIAKAFMSVPLVAGAVVAATTKGKVSTRSIAGAKAFGKMAGFYAIGLGTAAFNHKVASKNQKVNKAETKHPLLTLTGLAALATGAAIGAETLARKISPKAKETLVTLGKKVKLDKLAERVDKAPEAVRTAMSGLAEKVTLPKGVKDKLSTVSSKIKVPQFLKDGYKKVAELDATQSAVNGMKKLGKSMLRNPGTTAFAAIGAVLVAHGIKRGLEANATKAKLKDAQMKTANNLINAYAAENNSLKTANAKAAAKLEEANNTIASDKADDAE